MTTLRRVELEIIDDGVAKQLLRHKFQKNPSHVSHTK